jgi:chromate reductase
MRILGISGSLRRDSHNTRLLRAAAGTLPPGFELELYEHLRELPPYDTDLDVEPADPAVAGLRRAIEEADGVLIATPEFNGSLPGALKNALDWASRPFPENALRGKPVAVVGASTGLFGAAWAQAEARKVLGVIGADVIDGELPVGQADSAFGADGALLDAEAHTALEQLVGVLAERAGAALADHGVTAEPAASVGPDAARVGRDGLRLPAAPRRDPGREPATV